MGTTHPEPTIDLDPIAWDLSDALAKTVEDHGIDVGADDIKLALPAFLEALRAGQHPQEVDRRDHHN